MRTVAALSLGIAAAALACHARADGPIETERHARELMEQGRAAFRAGDRFTALRTFSQARALRPGDRDILQAIADVLIELNAPQGAAQALGEHVDIGVRSRQAASMVRWGEQVPPLDPAHPFADTDAAIAGLQALIAEAGSARPVDAGLMTRLRRDLLVAYRDRERWTDALAMADTLRASGDTLPLYVRLAEADALLGARRPEEARWAYQDVIEAEPGNHDALIGRFYAEIEGEDFNAAFTTADGLAAGRTPWRYMGINPVPQPDEAWLEAQVLAAQARRYADMPGEAWRRIRPLAAAAPAAPYLRAKSGEAAAARGWVRMGHDEILIARSLAPDDFSIRLDLAESEFRRRQWNTAQAHADELVEIHPANSQLRYLMKDLDAHRSSELRMEIAPRRAEGGGPDASGDGLDAAVRVYTPPIRERWRLLGAAERHTGEPTDVKLVRNRYGAGIEGRWPDVSFELVVWANTGMLSHGGADANLQWQPDDYWTFDFNLQKFSADTPLLAVEAGIDADAVGASATHAWNESRVASAGITALDFSDGNRRLQGVVDFAATIVDRPHLDVVLRPALYTSHNTRRDAPYFNPSRDGSLTLTIDTTHVMWRRYERSLAQRLVVGAGGYWQEGFGHDAIGDVTYEQTYRHDPRTEWNYGVGWSRRLYDGDAERALTAFVWLNQRF